MIFSLMRCLFVLLTLPHFTPASFFLAAEDGYYAREPGRYVESER